MSKVNEKAVAALIDDTFGLYSALRALLAICCRSNWQSKLTVDTMFLTHQARGWLGLHHFKLGSKLKKQSPINPFEIKSRKKAITDQKQKQQLFTSKKKNSNSFTARSTMMAC